MEKQTLKPLLTFVLEQGETSTYETAEHDWLNEEVSKLESIRKYAHFLNQPLSLGMFVPCSPDGNVLEEPTKLDFHDGIEFNAIGYQKHSEAYKAALDRVVFQGFSMGNIHPYHVRGWGMSYLPQEIERFTAEKFVGVELTPQAAKQLF